jgi:hypothetical protein
MLINLKLFTLLNSNGRKKRRPESQRRGKEFTTNNTGTNEDLCSTIADRK